MAKIRECVKCRRALNPSWNFCPMCGQEVSRHD